MKYSTILFLVILLSCCSNTKQIAENPQKEASKLESVVTENIHSTTEIPKIIIEAPNSTKTIIPKDSLQFNQEVSKRTLTQHQLWDELLVKHVTNNGNVDYNEIKKNPKNLYGYIRILQLSFPKDDASKNEKLAYWINAYNAMTIDLIIRNYSIKSIKDIKDPWGQRLWKLGEKWYNLDEIEHQILRKMDEPRIHFAIVCASKSCPKLLNEAYTANKLDSQLTQATKDFLSDSSRNNITSDNIKISKIFQWFSKDFTQNGNIIDFLNQYSNIEISASAKKSYLDYNWDLNE